MHLFCDEFTNFNDVPVGIAAVELLAALGYTVVLVRPGVSGQAMISKGFLRRARRLADRNVSALQEVVDDEAPRPTPSSGSLANAKVPEPPFRARSPCRDTRRLRSRGLRRNLTSEPTQRRSIGENPH